MPGFTTHYLFGQQTYQQLAPCELKQTIQKYHRVYTLGLQGPDIFFYDISFSAVGKSNPGSIAHTTNTGDFLMHLLKGISLFSSDKKQKIAQAYVLGFIGHYVLDTHCHPYIYARSGYEKKDAGYMGKHILLETDIDSTLLWSIQQRHPSEFHQSESIALTKEQMDVISDLLCTVYTNTYPSLNIRKPQIQRSIMAMQKVTRLFSDPTGYKKMIIRRFESIKPGYPILSALIPTDTLMFFNDPCNEAHKRWHNPWDISQSSTESFMDLFEKAGTEYKSLLTDMDWLFSKEPTIRQRENALHLLITRLGSRSYHSGLPTTSDLL